MDTRTPSSSRGTGGPRALDFRDRATTGPPSGDGRVVADGYPNRRGRGAARLTSEDGGAFLYTALTRRFTGPVQIVQTDVGPEFKGAFAHLVPQYCARHRIARPYK